MRGIRWTFMACGCAAFVWASAQAQERAPGAVSGAAAPSPQVNFGLGSGGQPTARRVAASTPARASQCVGPGV